MEMSMINMKFQEKAKVKLGEAIEILNNCGAGGWVAKYEKEMAAFK